jgi:hypothetical protein
VENTYRVIHSLAVRLMLHLVLRALLSKTKCNKWHPTQAEQGVTAQAQWVSYRIVRRVHLLVH